MVISCKYADSVGGMTPHYHDCHQLLYIVEGNAKISVGAEQTIAEGGTLVLISRFEEHAIDICSARYRRYVCRVAPENAVQNAENYRLLSVLFNRTAQFRHAVTVGDPAAFEEAFARMATEYAEGLPFSEEACDLLLQQLLIALYRQHPALFAANDASERAEIVRQIQCRFAENCEEKYSLGALAAEYHLSPYYLAHVFKAITGYSLMVHLQSCRIAAAKKYLTETQMRIGEIVEACGFSDNSNFSRTFRRQTGLSPKAFRERYAR